MVIDEDFYLFWFLKFTDELGFDSEKMELLLEHSLTGMVYLL